MCGPLQDRLDSDSNAVELLGTEIALGEGELRAKKARHEMRLVEMQRTRDELDAQLRNIGAMVVHALGASK